ncbi:hypothetical protein SAMN05216411_12415 [Nitrosospira multiformis]|nr:hypothetical protein SAMN05216411_12415 [Nitrosospira multiformis]
MLLFLPVTATQASLVTIQFSVNPTMVYDYPSRSYDPLAPTTSGVLSLTFDIDQRTIRDYGTTTITTFGGVMGTTWSSPVTALIPLDPYTGAYGHISSSYTFPNVSDYSSDFLEHASSQANAYQIMDGEYSVYHISVIATRRSAARSGDGTSDYAFTRDELLDFYRSFQESNARVSFNESYAVYRFENGLPVYSDGKSWEDYYARVINVIDHAETVPVDEPVIILLLAAGGIPLLMIRGRKISNTDE